MVFCLGNVAMRFLSGKCYEVLSLRYCNVIFSMFSIYMFLYTSYKKLYKLVLYQHHEQLMDRKLNDR